MTSDFSNIEVLIWDFDGTFYMPNTELGKAVRNAGYSVIMNHTGLNKKEAVALFENHHKKVFPSATQTLAHLSGIPIHQAEAEREELYDRRDYVDEDKQLQDLFTKLKRYRHFILANGVKANLLKTMAKLGIDPSIFEEIVTSALVGANKPAKVGFEYILKKTKLLPQKHLMIGDRESHDIQPAKELGIQTCLVYSDKKSAFADIVLPTTYALGELLV